MILGEILETFIHRWQKFEFYNTEFHKSSRMNKIQFMMYTNCTSTNIPRCVRCSARQIVAALQTADKVDLQVPVSEMAQQARGVGHRATLTNQLSDFCEIMDTQESRAFDGACACACILHARTRAHPSPTLRRRNYVSQSPHFHYDTAVYSVPSSVVSSSFYGRLVPRSE